MDNNDVANIVPVAPAELEGLQVAAAEVEMEVEVEDRLENGGGCGEQQVVAAVAVENGGEHEGMMTVAVENGGEHEEGTMAVVVANGGEHDEFEEVRVAVENDSEHEGVAVGAVANSGGEDGSTQERRKRGRPRKQLGEIRQELRVVAEDSGGSQKRGRGRPKGSGKWQTLAASFGLSAVQSSGSNFTPYIIDIQAGENIVQKIRSFSQKTSDSFCILSASGTVSSAEIFLPASRSGVMRYEGHFTIVCLNGSHTYDDKRSGKSCLLSAQLASPNGGFCGGAVASSLIAAGPTQIIVSTFRQNKKQQSSVRTPSIAVPNPVENGTVAAAPLMIENGKLVSSEGEVRGGVTTAVHQRAVVVVEQQNGVAQPHSSAAHEPADWTCLQPSNIS